MPRPEEWKGSDLRARSEVVQWLHDHGGEVQDDAGLVVTQMRADLGKGRALSQLLADMDHDGMIERDVRGRRTNRIKLLDDWGLLNDLRRRPIGYAGQRAPSRGDVDLRTEPTDVDDGDGIEFDSSIDLTALAEMLLAVVIRRAHPQASQGAELERLREKVAKLEGQLRETRTALAEKVSEAQDYHRQADTMRKSLEEFQRHVDRPKKRGGTPLREMLTEGDRKLLDSLMRSTPASR